MSSARVVVALGGNALVERTERPDADIQEHRVLRAVEALAPVARDRQVVVVHGNGPQVGALAAESERDPDLSRPYPFDVLVAQTQGMIGYWLLQALENALPGRGVATILTQTVVDADDPTFIDPHKFVGPLYDEDTATSLAARGGWEVRGTSAAGAASCPRPSLARSWSSARSRRCWPAARSSSAPAGVASR
jgi:carbamate kinase